MKHKLRQKLRQLRSELTQEFQQKAAEKIAEIICESEIFKTSQNIAAYLPINGEIDPINILNNAWKTGKSCYLPITLKNKQLAFAKYKKNAPLITNKFGICEPIYDNADLIDPQKLDLVIVPLVGFNQNRYRLGHGGGYYDRAFAFTKQTTSKKPYLIGIAYELQNIDIPVEPWDIQLNMLVTEKACYGVI
jgi:5-formyltetrahydrofolate cyclo-ligase